MNPWKLLPQTLVYTLALFCRLDIYIIYLHRCTTPSRVKFPCIIQTPSPCTYTLIYTMKGNVAGLEKYSVIPRRIVEIFFNIFPAAIRQANACRFRPGRKHLANECNFFKKSNVCFVAGSSRERKRGIEKSVHATRRKSEYFFKFSTIDHPSLRTLRFKHPVKRTNFC